MIPNPNDVQLVIAPAILALSGGIGYASFWLTEFLVKQELTGPLTNKQLSWVVAAILAVALMGVGAVTIPVFPGTDDPTSLVAWLTTVWFVVVKTANAVHDWRDRAAR